MSNLPEQRSDAPSVLPVPVGLLLSIGDTTERNGVSYPIQLGYMRPKPGALGQYQDAADKFTEVFGPEPKRIDSVYFLADDPHDVLDVRLLAFSKSGLRLRGHTNYAAVSDPDEFQRRAFSFEDAMTYYPKNATEVRKEIRDEWAGEPIEGQLTGPTDPTVAKHGVRIVASLSFLLPEILGVGMRVVLTTGSRRSIRNFHAGVWSQYLAFRGLLGRPFRLTVRPARTQRFDQEKRAYVSTTFHELVLDTPQTVTEIFSEIRRARATLTPLSRPALPAGHDPVAIAEAQIAADALDLPTVDVAVFDEVEDVTADGVVVESGGGDGSGQPSGESAPTLFTGPTAEQEQKRLENIARRERGE